MRGLVGIIVVRFITCAATLLVVSAAGPSSNFNPCSSTASGFKGVDSTNRVTYVECLNFEVLQSYECSDGSYFNEDTGQCMTGSWVDSSGSSSQAENVCKSVFDGFVAIDASIYAECLNYVEVGRYSCPEEDYFDENLGQCIDKNAPSVSASTSSSTNPATSNNVEESFGDPSLSIDTTATITPTCENIVSGKVPLPSLEGFLVCSDGELLVTEYCGSSKLYDIEYEVCVNYCEGNANASGALITQVQLPKLAGQVTCDYSLGVSVETVVCSLGTYFDSSVRYCRNFCENVVQQYSSLPGQIGGVTCQNEGAVAVEWCDSGAIYNSVDGECVRTELPSLSPATASPTLSPVTDSPIHPPTLIPTISVQPSLDLEVAIDVPYTSGEEMTPEPELIDVEDNDAEILIFGRVTLLIFNAMSMYLFL